MYHRCFADADCASGTVSVLIASTAVGATLDTAATTRHQLHHQARAPPACACLFLTLVCNHSLSPDLHPAGCSSYHRALTRTDTRVYVIRMNLMCARCFHDVMHCMHARVRSLRLFVHLIMNCFGLLLSAIVLCFLFMCVRVYAARCPRRTSGFVWMTL